MERFGKQEAVGSLLVEDFGQKVDLTRRIREVLTNYPEGTTVLKEIIQNADDAGATKVCFCLDRRTHGTQSLLCEQLKEWQGPALMAYNNSQFTEQDFVSISRIGDSQKRGQAWKTGRFGVGFNSVYHLTDLPSFVSGKYVVFFDPQGKYLPNISAANPGKRIDYVSSAALSLYKDQFSSYCTFDCDMRNSYSGTLFRFPLRNMEQAAVSKLSRQSYSEKDILALFTQLYTEAVFAMLFLKNITTLEMYVWNASAQTPERMYSCYLDSPNSEVVWHRQALLRLSNLNKNVGSELDTFSLDFVRQTFDATENEQIVDSFMIVQSMASSSSKIGVLANNAAKEHDLHLLPWASVAACISGNVSKDLICRDGRAFCFLPLPVRTGLPVHVNGYFELSSNRRDIWYGSDMDRGGKLRSDWNVCLLEEVVAPAFSELLMKASKPLGPSEQYYSLWPRGPFEEPWETLVKQIYRNIQEFPSLYSKVEGGKWILPAAAFLHDEEFSKSKELVDVLIFLGMPVVELPKPVVDMLFSYCATLPKMVCPATVRNMLRRLRRKSLLDRGQSFLLLEYCLDDLVDDEVGCMASGLSLIPLASGRYGVFEEGIKARPYFICSDSEYKLLGSLTDRLVDKNIPVKLHNRLSDIARASKTNITFLNSTHLVHLLSQILPTDWRYKEIIEWMPETDENHPTQAWVKLLWCYLKDHCEDISNFLDWPILPTTTGCLYRASKNSKMINGQSLSDSIKDILIKVGCQILNPDFEVEHRQLSLYVHDASAVGILDAIFEVALRQESHLAMLFENIKANERRELCRYFLNPKWYSGGQMTESYVRICKHLPIFELYNDNVSNETSHFTDLETSQKFLVPLHMDSLLLGSDFLYSSSGSEEEVLLSYYGIQRMGRASFYTCRVLNRISEISPQLLEDVMLSILYELPQLCAQDSTIREILKNLEFVPTISGRLRSPNSLYDPRNEELYDLLDDHDSFPCGKFRESGALDMLQGLELKTTVSPETVLQSARQIESLVHNDPAKAHSRGEVLLSYLELNANKWLPQSPGEANKMVNKMLTKMSSAFHLQDSCSYIDLTKFWSDLTMICWCPVLVNPPYSLLPWPLVSTTVAPPKLVRLPTDIWLVSASLRILDGECRSNTLSHCLGWSSSPGGSIIAAQLLELGKNHEIVADQIFRQELALAMPRLYSLLTAMIGTDEMDIVKAILEGSRWVWVGDGFAKVDEVVLYGPLHLAPYVRVIPVDLAVFKDLFMDLGVRESLSPRDFAMVLSQMAANKKGSPLNAHELRAATLIVQYLADAKFHDKQIACYIPDVSSILMPVTDLAFNDAPWLSTSNEWGNSGSISPVALTSKKKVPKFVHGNISNDVAERLGVYSLRRLLLAESADSMNLGLYGAAEAFGQHEALTTRLKHIVEMYADGPGILFELVQNADDAGATEVCFLLDKTQYGTSSILSPQMADWQGPALYCYNNSVFTAQDLYAISRIGQDSKLEKPFAIGRFGLGFNSVYHFTDIPGFVSGENIVMFDPHASYLPGITPSHPGLRISFVGRDILEQFPDQFSPYMHFGCDLQNPFPGTLFRFPLRTSSVSACSQIKKESYRPEDVLSLFLSFYTNAGEALLFLRNVMNISVYVKDGSNHEMVLLHRVSRLPVEVLENQPSPANVMIDFIYGDCKGGMDKEKFFQKLQKTPETQLPWSCAKVIMTSSDTTEKSDLWMVSECLGGGHAKAKSVSPENRERSFIPWAGVAAKLQTGLEKEVKGEANLADNALEGRAFCFLPLPVNTGLPVHINGYFELSSNRRDIWFGDDMAGGGKLRSDWNRCLLEDAAAPAYARLLANVAREIGPCSTYYLFWPTASTREPWASLMQKVYVSITDLEICVLYTNARGGQWISAKQAVFPDYSFAEAIELGNALAEAGLTLINAPKSVVDRFREFCPSLRYLTPHLLRTLLIRRKRGFKQREAMLVTLKYCLDDVDDPLISDKLHGLSLLPLATGLFTTFAKSGQGENIYVTSQNEYDLLKDAVPYLLIELAIDAQIFSKLQRIASSGGTNLCLLTSFLLKELMPKILPVEWEGRKSVLWTPGYQGQPSLAWMGLLWNYFKSSCPDLTVFSKWPLLPARDGHLLQLVRNSNVIKDDGWSENMCSLLKKTGCFMLRSDLQIDHAALEDYVQNATATGVLNALLASAAGIPNLRGLFTYASEGELRELRSFLCQSKWFSVGQVNSQQIDIMKALPIFESHGNRQFVSLTESIKWLKPNEVDEELINDSFIHTSSEREDAILRDYLGIQRPSKKQFYREHMVNTLSVFASQPEVMLKVVRDLKLLIQEDSTVGKSISDLPFILTAQGSLQKPGRLYDPRVPELLLLLHEDAFFPSREFKAPEILDFLVEMGLKNSLGQKGLLDSARSIAMLNEAGKESEAFKMAKGLLAFINKMDVGIVSTEPPRIPGHEDHIYDDEKDGIFTNSPKEESCETHNDIAHQADGLVGDELEEEFWMELANTCWCPVYIDPPVQGIPWPKSIRGSLAPPKVVRQESQMWLVSSTMRILDGECHSSNIQRRLGWLERPNVGVLAAQLIELSKTYSSAKSDSDSNRREFLDAVLQKEVPSIYSLMQDYVATEDFVLLQSLLEGVQWVWIGDNFVSSKELAFDSPAKFQPYLYVVPSELSVFKNLLTALGVRLTFDIMDYIRVLQHLNEDMKGKAISSEQLSFVLRVLEAVADALGEKIAFDSFQGSILVPDTSGILRSVSDLVYNDAPWLARTNIEVQNYVHSSITNDLAERLGAKSLRNISFMDQEMTKDLPCMDHIRISEVLKRYGNYDLLLFDLLEIADRCKARKLHVVYDKRDHPRQSLLQPNLGEFQGPSLTVVLEGAVLSMEEICILQLHPPWNLRGQAVNYGSGLLSCYQFCDVSFIVSGGFLYLFDPFGLVLSTSLNRGDSLPSELASARMYSLQGTDLPERFQDQFRPLSFGETLSWASSDSTIIRMPLKSKFADEIVENGPQRIQHIFDKFKAHASSALLFLKSVEQVWLSSWEGGQTCPSRDYAVSVDPSASSLRSPFPEKKWRKFQLSNLFSSSSVATKLYTIDVHIIENGSEIVDRWFVALTLGSGQTRNMALDRRFMSYNLAPIAGVAANISRNGKALGVCLNSCILSPLPLTCLVNLPVTIYGCFLLYHNDGRYLFENQASRNTVGNRHDMKSPPISSWNMELMACARDSYVELMLEFQRLKKDPLTSRLEISVAQGVSGVLQSSADRAYLFWPRSRPKISSSNEMQTNEASINSLTASNLEWECIVEKVIRPFYSRLVELPVWQLYGGAVVKAEEGMFLATPGFEIADHSPPATVCSFIKEHYPVFAVPWEFVREIEAVGISVKEITPKMVRDLLKASPTSIVLRSVETYIDILEYCFSDLRVQQQSISSSINPSPVNHNASFQDNANRVNLQSIANTSRSGEFYDPAVNRATGQNYLRNSRTSFQRVQNPPAGSSLDAGGDPLEIVTNFGRALLDFGRGVVEDFSKVGGPSTQADGVTPSGYGNITSHDTFIVGEIKGLPCPTATKHLSRIGLTELWIGNKEQQMVMLPLAVKFIHLQCFDRPSLTELFENRTVQRLLRLQPFSSQLLSAHLKSVLSKQWVTYVNDMGDAPWVSWDYVPDSLIKGPSTDWLRLFWKNIGSSVDELRLFSDWPLIPAIASTPVLCRVRQRHLVFIPPEMECPTEDTSSSRIVEGAEVENSSFRDYADLVNSSIKSFEVVESKHSWLLPLLNRCNVPVYDKCFLDCNALQCCQPRPGQTLGQVVISKLLAAKQAGYFSSEAVSFSSSDCDSLFSLFASDFSPSPSLIPTYSTEELDMLRSLAIYRTVVGTYTSLNRQDACIVSPGAFFQPVDERCLCYFSATSGGLFYRVLGVSELQNQELLVKFGLPAFEQKIERDQECILIYLYLNWEDLQMENTVIAALKETRFVKSGANEVNSDLLRPRELLDPGDSLLKSVFAGDSSKFPGGRFATDGWLRILRKVGLRTASEPEMLLECARKVEMLAKEAALDIEISDFFVAGDSLFRDELPTEIWSLAGTVVETILKNFAVVYGSSFCNPLSQIAFVPAEKGMPSIGGRKGGKRVLTSYSEAILLRDWPLAWTCAPILARQNFIPPEFSWGALHLRSPPPFLSVLKHLQIVGKNGGEEMLARWPTATGMKSVEDAFNDVLKYLCNIWGTLSSSDILELKKVPFIPIANGTRLVTASFLFVRLGVNLAPFAFELPSLYLPYVGILRDIGLQEAPTFASARALLVNIQQESGYQHLNPNELRAVLHLLQFICEEGKRSKVDGSDLLFPDHDAVVPDEGCRLVHARVCVYVDAHGSCLLGEIDTSRLRFANPQLSEDLCMQLGVKKLSDVVVEELDQRQPLATLKALGSLSVKTVTTKLLSPSFHTAVWMVIHNFKEHIPSLRHLTKDEVKKVLGSASEKLCFVHSIYTCFVMLPSSVDITLNVSTNIKQSLFGEKGDELGHRVLQFVDRSKHVILVAEPPDVVAVSDILAAVVSRLLDSPMCLPISALFNVPIGSEVRALDLLRLASHSRNGGNFRSSVHQGGQPGQELIPADAMQVQFHPLRPFYAGEIIAWRSDSEGGVKLKYGKVPEDVRPSAGQAMYRLLVETAPGEFDQLLSSNVLSFKSMVAGSSSRAAENNEAGFRSGSQHVQNIQEPRKPNTPTIKFTQNQEKHARIARRVSSSEIVHAVSDMLSAAGIPMGLEKQLLLQQTLTLKEELTSSQAALVVEQERADSAVKEAETAKTAWSCRVCLNSEVDTMLTPCGHVLCQRCFAAVARCPFCRRQVSKALRMYRP